MNDLLKCSSVYNCGCGHGDGDDSGGDDDDCVDADRDDEDDNVSNPKGGCGHGDGDDSGGDDDDCVDADRDDEDNNVSNPKGGCGHGDGDDSGGDDDDCVDADKDDEDDNESNPKDSKIKKKKPTRPCLFCGIFFCDVRRHILFKHKEEPRVKSILQKEKSGTISREERIKEFDRMRKEAILEQNKSVLAVRNDASLEVLICERKSQGKKVICSTCSGFFSEKYFHKHQKHCTKKSLGAHAIPKALCLNKGIASSSEEMNNRSDEAWENVYSHMKKDSIFLIIDSDEAIQAVGKQILASRKPNKFKEAKMKCRVAMRRLATLVNLTEGVINLKELFHVRNCAKLEVALHHMSLPDDKHPDMKAGLKIALGTLIKLSCKLLISHFIIQEDREMAGHVREFQEIFSSPTYYAKIFSGAEYQLKEKRQRENRKPSALPNEEDIKSFKDFVTKEIHHLSLKVQCRSDFIKLRRMTLGYLTLFNARRGSEVARLKIRDWLEKDSWIDTENLDEDDFSLLENYSVTFVMGKGHQLVPVFIPKSCCDALATLADKQTRIKFGVSEDNLFLFPYTGRSADGSIGYNEIKDICDQINIPVLTATSIRHRASTRFWSIEELDERRIDSFMEHLGHHKDIDKNVYACPPAMRALNDVAPILHELEKPRKKLKKRMAWTKTKKSHMTVSASESDDDVPLKTVTKKSKKKVFDFESDDNVPLKTLSKKSKKKVFDFESDDDVPLKTLTKKSNKKGSESDSDEDVPLKPRKRTPVISDSETSDVSEKEEDVKERPYTRWSKEGEQAVVKQFQNYISGLKGNVYPGQHEIQQFQKKFQQLDVKDMSWKTIKTKVINEKNKCQKQLKKMKR